MRYRPLALLLLCGVFSAVEATPIVYTFRGSGTATLSTQDLLGNWVNSGTSTGIFTITALADTTGRYVSPLSPNNWRNPYTSLTIAFSSGIAPQTFTDPGYLWVNNDISVMGVTLDLVPTREIYSVAISGLSPYDMISARGPLSSALTYLSLIPRSNTSDGRITVTGLDSSGTFEAVLVTTPEPSTMLLLVSGLVFAGVFRRR